MKIYLKSELKKHWVRKYSRRPQLLEKYNLNHSSSLKTRKLKFRIAAGHHYESLVLFSLFFGKWNLKSASYQWWNIKDGKEQKIHYNSLSQPDHICDCFTIHTLQHLYERWFSTVKHTHIHIRSFIAKVLQNYFTTRFIQFLLLYLKLYIQFPI